MNESLNKKTVFGKANAKKAPAIFLDRDGVVIKDKHYIQKPEEVELRDGICSVIKRANAMKWKVVVITNQSGVGRGYFGWTEYDLVTDTMVSLLKAEGAFLDGIYACGEKPSPVEANWRKPNPGMILEAATDLSIDTSISIVVGDRLTDIQAGVNAGIRKCFHVLENKCSLQRNRVIDWESENRKANQKRGVDVGLLETPADFPLEVIRMLCESHQGVSREATSTNRLKALLLAGGYGTRLKPFTNTTPKCLAPVGGKPILGHWINKLYLMGCSEIVINTHYLSEQVSSYLSGLEYGDTKLTVSYEEELLGTAGTLRKHLEVFKGGIGLIIHADNLMLGSLDDLLDAHQKRPDGCLLTMLTFTTSEPESCGIVKVDSSGRMEEFHEKVSNPPGNIANGAVYAFDDQFLDYFSSLNHDGNDLSADIISEMSGRIYTYHTREPFIDIGTPRSLDKAQWLWARGNKVLEGSNEF